VNAAGAGSHPEAEHGSRRTAARTDQGSRAAIAGFHAVLVSIAAPDRETARRLARLLVEERLAACVQVVDPIRSVYRWQGAVKEDAEVLLLAKSSQERVPRIDELLRREHPYELPELAAVPIVAGSPGYLEWLKQCLG
jgi:periplasmic divalent cation tolerance protein